MDGFNATRWSISCISSANVQFKKQIAASQLHGIQLRGKFKEISAAGLRQQNSKLMCSAKQFSAPVNEFEQNNQFFINLFDRKKVFILMIIYVKVHSRWRRTITNLFNRLLWRDLSGRILTKETWKNINILANLSETVYCFLFIQLQITCAMTFCFCEWNFVEY